MKLRAGRQPLRVYATRSKQKRLSIDDTTSAPLVKLDYKRLLSSDATRPFLCLAPMENLADYTFRRAHAKTIGGADEYCTEFIRCPDRWEDPSRVRAITNGIARRFDPRELASFGSALGAQIMGSNSEVLGSIAASIAASGASRVDLNCGCPANVVTGKGAGSSMLKSPDSVFECASAIAAAAGPHCPASLKMRSGFADTGLFEENIAAVEAAGVSFLTLHARTKVQRYTGRADWSLVARARSILKIPIIGNGDVTTPLRAKQLLEESGCGGVMIGRGAVRDPLIFWRIRRDLYGETGDEIEAVLGDEASSVAQFLRAFAEEVANSGSRPRNQVNRIKQVCSYLFTHNPELRSTLPSILRRDSNDVDPESYLEECTRLVMALWRPGPSDPAEGDGEKESHAPLALHLAASSERLSCGSSRCDGGDVAAEPAEIDAVVGAAGPPTSSEGASGGRSGIDSEGAETTGSWEGDQGSGSTLAAYGKARPQLISGAGSGLAKGDGEGRSAAGSAGARGDGSASDPVGGPGAEEGPAFAEADASLASASACVG